MQNILVTGGAGFIGSNFIHFLQRTEPDAFIVNLDALTYAANLENLCNLPAPNRHRFIEGDICNRELVDSILREHEIARIVHFAAESHVDRSIHGPAKFIQTNIVGTFTLLEAARQVWLQDKTVPVDRARFHHVSTDEVYGSLNPGDAAFTETTPYAPNSPYAASKASSDHLVRAYFQTYGLPVTITNCSNNYGPYQFPEKLIPLTILNALDGLPLPIYGDGMQVRDWLYVEDHCEAIWKVAEHGMLGETYNIGGNNQPANIQVVKEICGILDNIASDSGQAPHARLCRNVADRPGHDRRYAMDITKIRKELGWHPKEDLHSGLFKTVRWYLDNPGWAKAISRRPDYQTWLQQNYGARGENR
jgi:dTDP-glucose 4,6-dehydratase